MTTERDPVDGAVSQMLDAALAYVENGFRIFPTHNPVDGAVRCSCGNSQCERIGKHPRVNEWQNVATMDHGQIREWWTSWPNANIGIPTGAINHITVVDVDPKNGGDKTWARLLRSNDPLPITTIVDTGSGGNHWIFAEVEGVESGAHLLGEGVDIRGDGGYVIGAGSLHASGKRYSPSRVGADVGIQPAPDWLVKLMREGAPRSGKGKDRGKRNKYGRTPIEQLHWLLGRIEDGEDRDGALISLAGMLWGDGITEDRLRPLLERWAADHLGPPAKTGGDFTRIVKSVRKYGRDPQAHIEVEDVDEYLRAKLERAEARGTVDPDIDEVNAEHAVLIVGNKTAILYETTDERGEETFSLMPVGSFGLWMKNRRHDLGNGKSMPLADHWLGSPKRRQYKAMVFAPKRDTPGFYNLWKGFSVEPREGDCSLFLNHIKGNVCHGNEDNYRWVMGWFADIVQNPAVKNGTSVVFKGPFGTGKTIVGRTVGSLFKPHYWLVARPRLVTGNFNGHLARLLLLHADEAFWAGDHEAEGSVKDLITNDEQSIEYKYFEPVRVANYVRLLVTGNPDWVVPAGMGERRFAVFEVGTDHMQDIPYFAAIEEQLDNGGREALLDYLLRFDLSTVNLRTIPKTTALFEQKTLSMTPMQSWWMSMLQDGELPGGCQERNTCPTKALFRSCLAHATRLADRRLRSAETVFGMFLKKAVQNILREKATIDYIDQFGERVTKVEHVYTLPSLTECRRAFAKELGQDIVWADEDPEMMTVLPDEESEDFLDVGVRDVDWEKGVVPRDDISTISSR